MADVFGGLVLTDDAGNTVSDPAVQGRARCLLLLECCARYLTGMSVAARNNDLGATRNLSNTLALNVIEITESNLPQLRGSIADLAKLLGITMMATEIPCQPPVKGVN